MTLILGIDAAWTENHSSGVALLSQEGDKLKVKASAPSYCSFISYASGVEIDWAKPAPGMPSVSKLLDAAERIGGQEVSIVAIDMPLSRQKIETRRPADNEISKHFGKYSASVHSPNTNRPGQVGKLIQTELERAGFQLATTKQTSLLSNKCLIEVYPHAALIRLMKLQIRLPYKAEKTNKYWPKVDSWTRKQNLQLEWGKLKATLQSIDPENKLKFPNFSDDPSFASLKPYEDAIDATICAWVGAHFHIGRVEAFGDSDAAIWVPK